MSTEKIEIKNKPKRPKKDNSKKGDIFHNCRCCGEYIRGTLEAILTAVIVKIAYNYEII